MTIAFMSLLSAVVTLHMEEWAGKMMLFPLLLIGAGSVVYWYFTELNGHGDLRPYVFGTVLSDALYSTDYVSVPVKGSALKLLLPMIGFMQWQNILNTVIRNCIRWEI